MRLPPFQSPLILTGAYGSGKTEIAMALAAAWAEQEPVTLIDLDFVTPYFRALDHQVALATSGVYVLAPEARVAANDAPAIAPETWQAIHAPAARTIVDLGGDPAGATVFGQFAPQLPACDLWAVVNFSRPATASVPLAQALLDEITVALRLPISGLISNTHLGAYTMPQDIRAGLADARRLGALMGVPVVFAGIPAGVEIDLDLPVLAITPRLRRPWE